MAKKTLETSESPQIVVENVGSDLQVKGWDRLEVLVKSSSDNDIVLEAREDIIFVSCPRDCVLYVPQKASIEVKQVGSNARFRSIDGSVVVGTVGTDLSVRDVGSAEAATVGTDLSVRRVREHLSVKTVGSSALVQDVGQADIESIGSQLIAKRVRGDLKVIQIGSNVVARDVDGQALLNTVGGNLHLRDVSGGIATEVGGNATVDFAPVSWQAYSIKAAGSIRCNIPADVNAHFEIECGSQRIRIKSDAETETIKENTYTYTVGDGGAAVKLVAGGNVEIVGQGGSLDDLDDFEIDFGAEIGSLADEITEQTTRQIEVQMEMLEEQLNTQLAGLSMSLGATGLSEERMRELEKRLEDAKIRAAQRAGEASQRTQERLERKIAAAQRKVERKARASAVREARRHNQHTDYDRPAVVVTPPSAPSAPKDPVSEEERMMILQMLQDRKISVDQAEQLLSALEGR
ncbi:MAG TPA: hypothetical protein DEH25_16770 [Chloroflexi bacterium]|nr:hypothetical protein [Chloroflexota bacterium]HBY07265.1 hypothetical protein [Chloroflexota bacterium]